MQAAGTTAPCRLLSGTERDVGHRTRRSPPAGRTVRRRRSRAWSTAGNVSAPGELHFNWSETAPVTGAQSGRPPTTPACSVRPVQFAFDATDATSGVDECDPDFVRSQTERVRYWSGAAATTPARRDRNFSTDYDATPPSLSLSAESGDGDPALSWQTSPEHLPSRSHAHPHPGGSQCRVQRPGTSFVKQTPVDNGDGCSTSATPPGMSVRRPSSRVHRSAAGRREHAGRPRRGRRAKAGAHRASASTSAPAAGSVFRPRPPVAAVARGAACAFLNVQLFRGKRKLLSVCPVRALPVQNGAGGSVGSRSACAGRVTASARPASR